MNKSPNMNENNNSRITAKARGFRGPSSVLIAVVVLSLLLTFLTPHFLTLENIQVLAYGVAILALVAFSQMVVIAAGGMNLSVGAISGLTAVVIGMLMQVYNVTPAVAIAAGLGLGIACGLLNGWLVTRLGLSAFIVTLATGSIYTGLNLGLTSGMPYYYLPQQFKDIGVWMFAGIPALFFIMLAFAVIVAFFFARIGFGGQILAMGANSRAAELAGVPINRTTILVHIISGLLASAAGICLTARLGLAQPTIGIDFLLASFAAPIIGGTLLSGGYLSVPGAVFGSLLLTLVSNGLIHLRIDVYWTQFVSGLIILGAGGIDWLRSVNEKNRLRNERWSIAEEIAKHESRNFQENE